METIRLGKYSRFGTLTIRQELLLDDYLVSKTDIVKRAKALFLYNSFGTWINFLLDNNRLSRLVRVPLKHIMSHKNQVLQC